MKPRNWAKYIWIALAVLEALAMLADLIGGQDPYRHQGSIPSTTLRRSSNGKNDIPLR